MVFGSLRRRLSSGLFDAGGLGHEAFQVDDPRLSNPKTLRVQVQIQQGLWIPIWGVVRVVWTKSALLKYLDAPGKGIQRHAPLRKNTKNC